MSGGSKTQQQKLNMPLKENVDSTVERAVTRGSSLSSSKDTDQNSSKSELGALMKELKDIKSSLKNVVKKSDINGLVTSTEVKKIIQDSVAKSIKELKDSLEREFEERLDKKTKELEEKIESLVFDNKNQEETIVAQKQKIASLENHIKRVNFDAHEAIMMSNYNEQYSRKCNIKILNYKQHDGEDLRTEFPELVKEDLGIEISEDDVIAIHRLPNKNKDYPNPVIVKLKNSEIKSKLMRNRKQLTNSVRFLDDITKKNNELMKQLRDTDKLQKVWYYNCSVWGLTFSNVRLKFNLYDDLHSKLQQKY